MELSKTEEAWGISLNDLRYAAKKAFIYTVLVTLILLAPLFFYFIYMKNLQIIQNELFLKENSHLIIKSMEEFNMDEKYFEYPRYKSFTSGLYDLGFKPIFTLLKYDIKDFKEGYHIDGSDAYLIIKLPSERYFGASYLILKNELSFASLYVNIATILFSIGVVVFGLSLFFLHSFAKPFKELNERLDNFIKDSIHEINTPLSIINVNIDLYNRKNPSNKYMQRMKAAVKVLSNIYEDMDYLVKYNRIEHIPEQIDFTRFVHDRVEYFSDIASMKGLRLQRDIDENILVFINQKELQRVIDNTLSNAIKYSYENNVVNISLHVSDNSCILSVKDFGIGIENIDKIFYRYYRENSNKGGFGIGLNIVKSIIDKMGITLQIESQPKLGSTFTYIFPEKIITKILPEN